MAIAGLKSPDLRHRRDVFSKADTREEADPYELELGWVFVNPLHRRGRIARSLCERLLESVPACPVFATTRPSNTPMIRILCSLGFKRVGRPFPRRSEHLTLFLRNPSA